MPKLLKPKTNAPGLYTGNAVKTVPAVREAIEGRNWGEAERQITQVGKTLEVYSEGVRKAAAILRSPLR